MAKVRPSMQLSADCQKGRSQSQCNELLTNTKQVHETRLRVLGVRFLVGCHTLEGTVERESRRGLEVHGVVEFSLDWSQLVQNCPI